MSSPLDHDKDIVTGGGEWGDTSLPSIDDARDYIAERMEEVAIIVEDTGDLPGDAHIRPNGLFIDLDDVIEYLERGGLVASTGVDENGVEHYQPLGFVYIIPHVRDDDDIEYQVYIRDDSD